MTPAHATGSASTKNAATRDACQSPATPGSDTGPPTSVPHSRNTASKAAATTPAPRRAGVARLLPQQGRRTTNTIHRAAHRPKASATNATYTAAATPEWRGSTAAP